jgi:hypothetical protein
MNKVRLIERSILCKNLGSFGVVPVIGVIPAIMAIVIYHTVSSEAGAEWNPAESAARRGLVLAWLGVGLTALVVGVIAAMVVPGLF